MHLRWRSRTLGFSNVRTETRLWLPSLFQEIPLRTIKSRVYTQNESRVFSLLSATRQGAMYSRWRTCDFIQQQYSLVLCLHPDKCPGRQFVSVTTLGKTCCKWRIDLLLKQKAWIRTRDCSNTPCTEMQCL
jgi:hypothetical protein